MGFGDQRAEEANEIVKRFAALVLVLHRAGGFWSIENPESSLLWLLKDFIRLAELPGAFVVTFDQCAYGAPSRKPTRILTNAPWLRACAGKCEDAPPHVHVELRGKVEDLRPGQHGMVWRTTLAAEYPEGMCNAWARALLGWSDKLEERLPQTEVPAVDAVVAKPTFVRKGKFGNVLVREAATPD